MSENKNAKTSADDGQPIAWRIKDIKQVVLHASGGSGGVWHGPEPQKKEWVGLGEDEIFSILENLQTIYNRPPTEDSRIIFARAIEAKLKEKNT